MESFGEIWRQFPPVTRNVGAAAAIINLLIRFYPPSIKLLYLWSRIPATLPWTLLTSGLAGNGQPLPTLFSICFLWINLRNLEQHSTRYRRGNLLFLLAFIQVGCVLLGPYFGFHGFLGIFCSSLVYVGCQESPNDMAKLFGLVDIRQGLLPWTNALCGLLVAGQPGLVEPLLGIVIGHMFIYLTELLPRAGGPGLSPPRVFADFSRWIDPAGNLHGTAPATASQPHLGKTSRFGGVGYKLG